MRDAMRDGIDLAFGARMGAVFAFFVVCALCFFAVVPGQATAEPVAAAGVGVQSSATYDCNVPGMRIEIRDGKRAFIERCSAAGNFTIPANVTVNGASWKLVGIGSSAFLMGDCENLESVNIPASIATIEQNAFYDLERLRSVTGCAGLKVIEEEAFADCPQLASFSFGTKLQTIGVRAFSGTAIAASAFPSYLDKSEDGSYRRADARLYVRGKESYKDAFKVLTLVNKERTKRGLSKLSMDRDLLKSAMQRAAETSVMFSHTRPDGTDCTTASAKLSEDSTAGENIAAGQQTPAAVMASWMNSAGHRANILDTDFKTIGIGCFVVGGQRHWVQMFGASNLAKASKRGNKTATHAICYRTGAGKMKVQVSPKSVRKGASTTLKVRCSIRSMSAPVLAKSFKFSSSKPKVLTVSSKGKLKGKQAGKAKVTLAFKHGTLKARKTIRCTG